MNISTVVGLVIGALCIVLSIISNGDINDFFDSSSIYIVIGGTFAACLVNYPLKRLGKTFKMFLKTLNYKNPKYTEVITKIIELSHISKKEGLLALEEGVKDIEDSFFNKAILMVVDGTNPEDVKKNLELEINVFEESIKEDEQFFLSLGKYAPAFGMVGTLIGLIKMLKNLNDSSTLGASMGVALITTFYGAVLANLVFIPIAGKVKTICKAEVLYKEIIYEGVLSIQSGEAPYMIEEKLYSFINEKNDKKKEEK